MAPGMPAIKAVMFRILTIIALLALSAWGAVPPPQAAPEWIGKGPDARAPKVKALPLRQDRARLAALNFVSAIEAIEPVAEAICREEAPEMNCDFLIVVDEALNAPPNAFQTLDDTGRPIIAFTVPLIAQTRNRDELAFILAHEAAHHILGHLAQQRRNATIGASILGGLAALGRDADTIRTAQRLGAVLGARTYSKEFELEADALGTVITGLAGFDPIRGAAFFDRIPDPGDSFLGTHPANADRLRVVQRVAARMARTEA